MNQIKLFCILVFVGLLGGSVFAVNPSHFQHSSNGYYYAYAEIPLSMLSTPIPTNAPWAFDSDGVQRTLEVYLTQYSANSSNALILLNASPPDSSRATGVSLPLFMMWLQYLGNFGVTIDDLMTSDVVEIYRDEFYKE